MFKEEIMAVQKEIKELKEQSLAMEMLRDSKRANKRLAVLYTIVLIISIMIQFAEGIYIIHILNSINTEETTEEITTTQEIHDVDSIDNSHIINGDNYGDN